MRWDNYSTPLDEKTFLSREDAVHDGVPTDAERSGATDEDESLTYPWPGDDSTNDLPVKTGDSEEEAENLAKVLNTIESLEGVRVTLYRMKNNGERLSREGYELISERISLAYEKNGLPENTPFFLSTESINYHNGDALDLTIEGVNQRIDALSTEANHFFARFWRNTKEFFGKELNRVDRMKKDIETLIDELENYHDWSTDSVVVRNHSALTKNGRLDLSHVVGQVTGLTNNHLKNGGFMKSYFDNLTRVAHEVDHANWGDPNRVAETIARKGIFNLGRPFVEEKSSDRDERSFKLEVSDLNALVVKMPSGRGKLYASSKYSSNIKGPVRLSGKAMDKEGSTGELPKILRRDLLKHLKAFHLALEGLPNNQEFNSISNNIKKQVETLSKQSYNLTRHSKEDTKWSEQDTNAVIGSIVLPLFVVAVLGIPGLLGLHLGRVLNNIASYGSNVFSNDSASNVYRNDVTNNRDGFLMGGVHGLEHTLINGLILKRYINSFENQTTLYFIGTYRESYALLKSTTNALLSYGYACMGKSNKY